MRKNKIKLLINISLALACSALFILLLLSVINGYSDSVLKILISAGVGLIAVYLLNSILHELGHLIVGLSCGLKFYSIKFLWFLVKVVNGRITFSLERAVELGSTVLSPNGTDKVLNKYVLSACGGLGATLALMIVQVAVCLASKSLIAYSALGITFPLTVYFFMVNLLPVFENCDGYLVYKYLSGGKERAIIENYFKATALLFSGVEPSDLDSTLLMRYDGVRGYSANIRYLRYLAYVKNDEERALKELREISDLSEISNLNDEIFEELFFSAILLNDKKFIKANEQSALAVFERPARPQTYRIHASYRIWSGEKDWAKLILSSGIKFCDDYAVKGIAKSEKSYMQLMLKNV
ncbi:MAG: hypothetical protein IJA97_03210 [Clostridia bacterium]|nr:hypothetical protein [Clostridia bacterium]